MTPSRARPEDRRRSGIDSRHSQPWADTHPGCFRSEAFAEDLPEQAPQTAAPRAARAWLLSGGRGERSPGGRGSPGGMLPLLGVALAGMLGAFGR
jgi:hypothetical protein